jgi:hemolysin III
VLPVLISVMMGWAIAAAWSPLRQALTPDGLTWLAAGGLAYTFGIVFFALDSRLAHAHGIWHLFVIAGSVAHYFAILRYVV